MQVTIEKMRGPTKGMQEVIEGMQGRRKKEQGKEFKEQ
jgi:hypothetical protein